MDKDDIKLAMILTLFFSGLISMILGSTLIKDDLLFSSGIGLFSASLVIGTFEFLMESRRSLIEQIKKNRN